jgi:hypothetical protein
MGFIWQTKAKMNDFILTDPEDVTCFFRSGYFDLLLPEMGRNDL